VSVASVSKALRLPWGPGRDWATRLLLLALVALNPTLGGAADAVKGEVTATVDNGFGRLLFKLTEDVESQVRLANGILVITFKRPVDVNVDKLSAAAPDYISAARRDPDGKAVRIALGRKVTLHSMAVAERLFVDLLPETWTALPPGLPRDVIEDLARRAREAERKVRQQRTIARQSTLPPVRVRVATQPTFTRYVFSLPELIGVSASNGKERLTLTFDALLNFDLTDAKASLPATVGAIESELDQESVVVRFTFTGKVDVRTFRDDLSYVVDVTSTEAKPPPREGSVRSDELDRLAAQAAAAKGAPPTGVEPPQTVPARAPPGPATEEKPVPAQSKPAMESAVPDTSPQPPAPQLRAPSPQPAPPAAISPPIALPPAAAVARSASAPPSSAVSDMVAPQTAPPAAIAQPAAEAARPANPPRDKGVAVNVGIKRQGDNMILDFPFATSTPAAVFLRADTLWLVFDTSAAISLAGLENETSRTIKSATLARQDDMTVIRIKLERPRLIGVTTEGPGWTISVGAEVPEPTRPLGVSRNIVGTARSSITIPFDDPRQNHRLADPDAGDTLLVVTALGPARGFVKTQDFVELRALASAHGVVLQPHADDLNTELAVDKIVITRPLGLTLSMALSGGPRTASTVYQPHVIDAQVWSFDRQSDFSERKGQLIHNAAENKEAKRFIARLDLARFYLARDMAPEAKAVLDVTLADNPPTAEDPTPLVLRAAALILMGRPEQGLKDLASPFVGNQWDAPLWRALAYARQGKWSDAREGFRNTGMAMGTLPVELQRLMLKEMMRAAIEVGDITGAINQIHEFEAVGTTPEFEPTLAVLGGRLAEGLGRVDDALRDYQTAADSWDRPMAAQGRLREIVLKRALGNFSRAEAIAELETLTTIWRGDETEVEALQLLARLYTEEGRYRDAFHIMRTATTAHPNSELTRRIQDEAAATFEGLFLGGNADALPAIEALSLFYDFRDLTPIGRRGDEMIRRLADRLVAMDLLDQAAELLQHQVDHRLQGAARAQIATKLAIIYLANRKPDRALATLRATRTAELNNELRSQRLLIEARALSELGRHDLALEAISNIQGREAIRLRSDIHWAARRWREAGEQIELLYGDRWKDFAPLNTTERTDILRAAIGFAIGEDSIGLMRFREKYAGKLGDGPDRHAFDVVTAPIGTSGSEFRDIARAISLVDTLDGFLADIRARYSEKDRGAAAPPRPSDAAPAAPALKPEPATTGGVARPVANAAKPPAGRPSAR
jgi:tetratricopeptide (TPR) repeat protein